MSVGVTSPVTVEGQNQQLNTPLVQVIMPVFNAAQYLHEALQSLLTQSYGNFQILAFNDGSTDDSLAILKQFADNDSRVIVHSSEVNRGIVETVNALLELASADFIARADADDIYFSQRLEKQVAFFQANPDISAVGCNYEFFGAGEGCRLEIFGDTEGRISLPLNHEEISACLTLDNVILNPSMMFRRSLYSELQLQMDDAYISAEDYKFWCLVSQRARLANMPEILCRYRVHSEQESTKNNSRQRTSHLKIVNEFLNSVGIDKQISDDSLQQLIWPSSQLTAQQLKITAKEAHQTINLLQAADIHNREQVAFFWDLRLKSLCRRYGYKGAMTYVTTRGIRNLVKGRYWGLMFLKSCFRGK